MPIPCMGLLIAQDTGGAIRGAVRGDIFFGFGQEAEVRAGGMKAQGRLYVLLPNAVAERAGQKLFAMKRRTTDRGAGRVQGAYR